ncbi:MAG TPA: FAD-binding oxidoreductase [Bacteroidia bacterium]|nr:oxidoreductase [Bacteroidota bacterium]MBK8585788.1 oxidoreductase [Bacteroidota bacterium]HQV99906.1 FAD-binding oxidoreductase [Bacteroidia bacterium]
MSYKYNKSTIFKIIQETELVKRFFFKIPDEIPFSFKAGQFIMLNLPIASKFTNRSYSIASSPSNDNTFELAIVLNPKGLGTPYLWENIDVGSEIDVSKALGKFTLIEPIEDDICFVCTGTGIAPLRSMLHYILNNNIPHKKIYMIFGNRWEKDIIYRKEMEDLAKVNPSFEYIPVLSRDSEGWTGRKGYVHPIYEEIFSDKRPATFYMCGWRDMLHEARQRLEAMGYDRKKIKFESYD